MAMLDAVLDFRVMPQPHLSRIVREGVTEFGRSHGVDEETLAYFLTALGEALANAIEHSRTVDDIEIEVRLDAESIVARVADNGIGFVVERAPDAAFPGIDSERGRGLPIMRRCSTIFDVTSTPGSGTSVVLGCRLRPADDESASEVA